MTRNIILYVPDMILRSRIKHSLTSKGWPYRSADNFAEVLEALNGDAQASAILDLDFAERDLPEIKTALQQNPELSKRMVGFFSHVNVTLKRNMQEAGFQNIFPRSQFFKNLNVTLEQIQP